MKPSPCNQTLPDFIRERRRSLGISHEAVAPGMGLSISRVRSIEAGYSKRGLSPSQVVSLEDVLQVPIEKLARLAGYLGTDHDA